MCAAIKLRQDAMVMAYFTCYCYGDFQMDIAISKMTSKHPKQYN